MKNSIYILGIIFFISSCGVQKRMSETRQELDDIKEQQATEQAKITAISGAAEAKLGEGKIDDNIKQQINTKLRRFDANNDSAKSAAAKIDSLLTDKKEFRQNYKSYVVPALDSLKRHDAAYADRLSLYIMLQDGLNIADYQLFDLAAFFGPGKYIIPDDKTDLAVKSFAPIIDSVINFSNKYKDIPKTATLIILGFADGLGFATEGALFDTLTAQLNATNASKEQLNQQLSELRAKELIKQLTKVFFLKKPLFMNAEKFDVKYIGQGKGENYPLPTIKDYLTDDPRRRIVLCYWAVLPD